MLKNYLKIGFRNLLKYKAYSFINIAGLAIGIACCSLILLYVYDELNYDVFHKKANRIYRVIETRESPDQGLRHISTTAGPLGETLIADFPEVIDAVRLIRAGRFTVQYADRQKFYEGDYFYSEPNFFKIFDFELLQGDPETALTEPYTMVITEKAARKYFGDEDPFGKIINIERRGNVKVTGVLKDPPHNSHLDFSMLISLASVQQIDGWKRYIESWDSDAFFTYILLNEERSYAGLTSKLSGFMSKYRGENPEEERQISLQPLKDAHLYSNHIEFDDTNQAKGDIDYIYIFSAIAFFIALIACINYTNLATARSFNRAKEVGMRKVVGAQRAQLIRQFLSEAILVALLALAIAAILIQIFLPYFNEVAAKSLSLNWGENALGVFAIIALALLAGIVSGFYPALFLSKFRPMMVLKGRSTKGGKASFMRQGLVVLQFVLSVTMIIATVIVYQQLNYMQEKRLGFNQEHLLIVDINSGNARSGFETMKAEFARSPNVKSVSVSSRIPGDWKNITEIEAVAEGAAPDELHTMHFLGVDADFLETYQMELVEGKNFTGNTLADSSTVIINEAAAKILGWDEPLGKRLRVPEREFEAEVVGVVKDFHFRSLHEKIGPMVLGYWNNPVRVIDYFTARISGRDIPGTLAYLEDVHNRVDKVTPFEYNFLDERLQNYYQSDMRIGRLVGISTIVAILIACLGLFGLAAFTAEQRTKEIGIRKVLGATVAGIFLLLSKDFMRLALIAVIIAIPIAYFALTEWLQNFAYHIAVGATAILISAALAMIILLLTISYQAIKSALVNPVKSLRYE